MEEISFEMALLKRRLEKHFFERSLPVSNVSASCMARLFAAEAEDALVRAPDFSAALRWINREIDRSPARAEIRKRISVAQIGISALERRTA